MNKHIICLAASLLLITSCGTSPKQAREELNKIGVAYSDEAFLQAFTERDEIAIDLFVDAERDASFLLADAIDFYGKKEHLDIDLIKKLIENSSNVNLKQHNNSSFNSALNAAVANNNREIVKLLLDKGANPNFNNDEALRTALIKNQNIKIADLLIDRGADINVRNKDTSLLSELILDRALFKRKEKPDVVKYLLDKGAEVNDTEEGLSMSLFSALFIRDTKLVETLLKKGAKFEFMEKKLNSPLAMTWEEKLERDFFNDIAEDKPEIITLLEKYLGYKPEEEYELVDY